MSGGTSGGGSGAASLHVWRVRPAAAPRVPWRLALDRSRLRRTPGVRFAKLLGTSTDRRFGPTAVDPTRWAAFVVWDSADAARTFPATPVGRSWAGLARAGCALVLYPVRSRGSWSGSDPFAAVPPTDGGDAPTDPALTGAHSGANRPVVALTRARLRASRAAAFWRTVPSVAAGLVDQPGLLAAFGIGEAPWGWQGTVSVWRAPTDLVRFAYRQPQHRTAIVDTPRRRWYAEELFARFAVLDVTGDTSVMGWSERRDRDA